jgi:DNA adenine methylase
MRNNLKKPASEKKAQPFLKWAGGKTQLLKQYKPLFPVSFTNYSEPFVGAGAVLFYLLNNGTLTNEKRITIIDSNAELINCYLVIKNDPHRLLELLNSSKFINDKTTYYSMRGQTPTDEIERAARTIYLNKTCFSGLYRVNNQGEFNVPFGRHKNPLICDANNITQVSLVLRKVEIIHDDFEKCIEFSQRGDFIYLDPPYQPLSKTSYFTGYTKNQFLLKEQFRVARLFKRLDSYGCKVMMSNSDTKFIRNLYKKFRIETVRANRAINCKAKGRGKINELVIVNY